MNTLVERNSYRFTVFLLIITLFPSCGNVKNKNKEQLNVFAAASLADVITEIADSFKLEQNIDVRLNFAASGTLARQIDQGVGADVYFSANKNWVEFLIEKKESIESSVFASNDMVLIAADRNEKQIENINNFFNTINVKIAIGDPGYVPAGKYASEILDFYDVDLSKKLFFAVDVRSALMMVEIGEMPYGIVYRSDALRSEKVKMIYMFPEDSHKAVKYHKVLTSEKDIAKRFYNYLYSEKAKEILRKHSFKVS